MDGIIADDGCRHIPVIIPVRRAPGLRAAKPGLLRAGEDYADLCVLGFHAEALHLPQYGDAHITAGQVVVRPVHHAKRIVSASHQQEEGDEQKPNAPRGLRPRARAADRADPQRDVIHHTEHSHHARDLKHDAAEVIVEREFPGGVDVPVQEDPLPDFARAGANRRHVEAFTLREQRVDHLFIKHKLKQKQQQGDHAGGDAQPRLNEEQHRAQAVE